MKRWFQIDLWKRVLAALLLGLGAGLALRYGMGPESSGDFAETWIGWLGELFLRMIKMLIIPLVFFTLVSGVVAMGDPKKLGSLGGRALAMYFGTTAIAVGPAAADAETAAAETPAAAAYNDHLAAIFFGLPVMREYLKQYEVRSQPSRHSVLHALVSAYQQATGRKRHRPTIAIVDWREVPTYSEFVISKDYFEALGFKCVIADPREVEYRGGKLFAGGIPIDVIYKRVLISELVERGGMDHPIVRAVIAGDVVMVNSFRCKILHKKASLAVLSDERNDSLFTATEREAIEAHVPWTRVVEERTTMFKGLLIDLIPYAAKNKDNLVLKPNDEYGGTGIVLGWEVDDARWQAALKEALAEPFIIQDRIHLPHETYPSLVDGAAAEDGAARVAVVVDAVGGVLGLLLNSLE